MATDADKQGSARRAVLDDFTTSLDSQSEMTPAARSQATALFDQALQDAANAPKSTEEVLADWNRTTDDWIANLEAMQKRGEVSATDVADIVRQFDDVTRNLRAIRQREENRANAGHGEPAAELPHGMPSDVARAFEQQLRKP
jgi:uncharacterized membrane protein YccC